mmetsp:Transcript_9143/g.29084  ORF Transcript_9143/g.29084 Transcript_9143/m.29084 type:complete len:281 (+) Transcript_9143:2132-2974(+)
MFASLLAHDARRRSLLQLGHGRVHGGLRPVIAKVPRQAVAAFVGVTPARRAGRAAPTLAPVAGALGAARTHALTPAKARNGWFQPPFAGRSAVCPNARDQGVVRLIVVLVAAIPSYLGTVHLRVMVMVMGTVVLVLLVTRTMLTVECRTLGAIFIVVRRHVVLQKVRPGHFAIVQAVAGAFRVCRLLHRQCGRVRTIVDQGPAANRSTAGTRRTVGVAKASVRNGRRYGATTCRPLAHLTGGESGGRRAASRRLAPGNRRGASVLARRVTDGLAGVAATR